MSLKPSTPFRHSLLILTLTLIFFLFIALILWLYLASLRSTPPFQQPNSLTLTSQTPSRPVPISNSPNAYATPPLHSQPIHTNQPPVLTPTPIPIGDAMLAEYLSPQSTPERDLTWMNRLLDSYRTLVKGPDPLPLGGNAEITSALLGKNRLQLSFLSTNHPALSTNRELIDRWGSPLFFHALASDRIEIRSPGPDRILGTADDITRAPNGTFRRGTP